uniref:Uncharacterized protein n=1 Tax=Mycena chlorophos TaxID=658473 RepID=A0ABQ0LM23_MYCCL|nr:predicted protein [Mycena chlorophos]
MPLGINSDSCRRTASLTPTESHACTTPTKPPSYMGRLTPYEIRAKDRERKARTRKALRQDPDKWQASMEKAREASRKYRLSCSEWLNMEKRRKRAV